MLHMPGKSCQGQTLATDNCFYPSLIFEDEPGTSTSADPLQASTLRMGSKLCPQILDKGVSDKE